ncbi:hypothetical protein ACTJIJ_04015 [Niabella sp. 22666]|uniref:hypothetical protein n=1 Tax=Niabella sp. 22666 TaxID=3453954 RepID=UPI003F84C111
MKKLLLLVAFILSADAVFAQAPSIQWQKALGGADGDIASDIQPTTDGGYIVAGNSSSNDGDASSNHGGADYWIVKLDAAGNKVWQKSFGGSANDYATSIKQTSDGGYIVGGTTFSNDNDVSGNHNPDSDGWVIKLDASGNLVWQKAIGGVGGDFITAILQTNDGGYLAGGYSSSNNSDASGNNGSFDFWTIKLDASGNISWYKMIGGSQDDRARALQQTADGGYIITGSTASVITGARDCLMAKLDASGNIAWQKTLGGTGNDEYNSIQQTTDGGYIAAGTTASNNGDVSGNHGGDDYWVVKLDASGNIIWQKTLGGSGTDWSYTVQQTTDGGYVALGVSTSTDGDVTGTHGNGDFWLAKLNTSGNLTWQKSFGGTGGDYGYAIRQTADGGFITAGFSNSTDGDVTNNHDNGDFWVVKLGAINVLPVTFGDITAAIKHTTLLVNFTTVSEKNNDRFIIEASKDGIHFKETGIIKSLAKDGNSNIPLQYSFSMNYGGLGMAGVGLFTILLLPFRKKRRLLIVMTFACVGSFISCKKNPDKISSGVTDNVFIRIAQVDKDGTAHYSKIVKAVQE